ncbi:MAG: DoxX family membrane protein [Anaerolineales bacterium]|nr:DoxX family membrane protein [Anaerolineales bacterium]
MEIAFFIGRIIVGLYWLMGAVNHFTQVKSMVPYAKMKNVPMAELAVPGTGALLLVAALSIITGFYPVVAVAALVVFLVPVTFMMHNFWTIEDPMAKMSDMIMFTKNISMLGYTLILLGIPQPWAFSLAI